MKKNLVLIISFIFLILYSINNVSAFTYYECNEYTVHKGNFIKTVGLREFNELYRDDLIKCIDSTNPTANKPEQNKCYVPNGSKYDLYEVTYTTKTYYRPDNAESLGAYFCQDGKKHIYSCEAANNNQELCSLMKDECNYVNNNCVNKTSNSDSYSYSPKTYSTTEKVTHEPFDICESSGFLQAIYIIKVLFRVVCFVIPIILIFTISMDVYKLISEPNDTKKVFPVIKKRLLAAIIILFIPTIVRLTMSVLNQNGDFVTCWNNANSDYIEKLKNNKQ